jgi:NADH dehydrogenase/NADH:ubiquinone oxidoreductase subunit G
MKKNVLLLIGAVLLLFLLFTSCEGGKEQVPTGGNIFIFRLSNPDEALNALLKSTDPSSWKQFQDTSTAIKTQDREKICYNIGVKSANALLSVFLDDYDTAEKISSAIKDAADKLNIKSANIETVAKQLVEDLAEKDEQKKQTKVKQTLNTLKDEVVKALNKIGNKPESVMIEFGAWIEALRQTSGIILENYSTHAASALLRKGEAEYFKAQFGSFNLQNPSKRYKELLDATSKLLDLMVPGPNKSLSEETIKSINTIVTQINTGLMA